MVELNIDMYDITMKIIVPGMIILAVLGVILYQMGDVNILGEAGSSFGDLIFGSGMKLP